MILRDKKIAFIHIPKCAGTMVETRMLASEGFNVAFAHNTDNKTKAHYHIYQQGWDGSDHHATLQELETRFDLTGWRIFTVVRDPLQRLLSQFLHQVEYSYNKRHRIAEVTFYNDLNLDECIRTSTFDHGIKCPRHEMTQSSFIKSDKGHEIRILQDDNLDEELENEFPDVFTPENRIRRVNATKNKKEAIKYSGITLRYLLREFGVDYDRFGFERPELEFPLLERTVHMYWHDAYQRPRLVKACIHSWKRLNKGWDIKVWSDADEFVKSLWRVHKGRKIAAFSDILRISLLHEFGGVWADATLMCLQPLDHWIDDALSDEGLFLFGDTEGFGGYFFAARKDGEAIKDIYKRLQAYWENRQAADHYFWMSHHILNHVKDTMMTNMHNYDSAWSHFHLGPHTFSNDYNTPAGDLFLNRLLINAPKMLKLSRHVDIKEGSKLDLLIKMQGVK